MEKEWLKRTLEMKKSLEYLVFCFKIWSRNSSIGVIWELVRKVASRARPSSTESEGSGWGSPRVSGEHVRV